VFESQGLELGVYVLVAPEADRQQPHADDEVYVVLEGDGILEVEGEQVPLHVGEAIFVPAHADHRFTAYESLAVLVVFDRR
jgi:mannose-6-phosphate isomerase-like protein (cupin superfamily)